MDTAFTDALALGVALGFVAIATARGRLDRCLAVWLAALVFSTACRLSLSQFGKIFGTGFGLAANNLGIPVLAAAIIANLRDRFGAPAGIAWRQGWARAACLCGLGLLAGTAALPAAGYAVIAPLRDAIGGAGRHDAPRNGLALGLAVSAGQALLLPSPALVAATAILAAPWRMVLAIGAPLALAIAGASVVICMRSATPEPRGDAGPRNDIALLPLCIACLAMLGLLCVQSLGDIPSEPFGGGGAREFLLGLGRPVVVLLTGVGILVVALRGWRDGGMGEEGWIAAATIRAAPLILLLAAAGGWQTLAQGTEMAPLLAERLLPLPWGLALPFCIAAVMKMLQGASLVAAITAAGMVQPLLPALGLQDEIGRALCALAVSVGAATGAHMTDGLFWLVADAARLRPAAALLRFTGGTIAQGLTAILLLSGLREIFRG